MWVHSPSWREEAKNTTGCKSDPAGRGQLWQGWGWKGRPSSPGSSSVFQSKAFALKMQPSLGRASDTSAVMTEQEALQWPCRLLSVPAPQSTPPPQNRPPRCPLPGLTHTPRHRASRGWLLAQMSQSEQPSLTNYPASHGLCHLPLPARSPSSMMPICGR